MYRNFINRTLVIEKIDRVLHSSTVCEYLNLGATNLVNNFLAQYLLLFFITYIANIRCDFKLLSRK